MDPILICTDLDRTLLPNGPQVESPKARPLFSKFATLPGVQLAFVSGRRLSLQLDAIVDFDLPTPDFIVGDVGASVYRRIGDQWVADKAWKDQLSEAWKHQTWRDIAPGFRDIEGLELQEVAAQADHKLSFNAPDPSQRGAILAEVNKRLTRQQIPAQLIWSVDETVPMGLLDIMAPGATKRHAVEHVIKLSGVPSERVLYAGDSGNDLPILVSPFPSVLVANATAEFREEARLAAEDAGLLDQLYFAKGTTSGLNGCYSAGILEGLSHFFPETSQLIH